MTDEKAQEVSIALSQNLILFHKGRRDLRGRQQNSQLSC
jgi:hypothetical protein